MTRNHIIALVFALLIVGCKSTRITVLPENERQAAIDAAASGQYTEAVSAWGNYFATMNALSKSIEPGDFAAAGSSAFQSGDYSLAVKWFDEARFSNYSDVDMYLAYAVIFQSQDNISRELNALNHLRDSYADRAEAAGVSLRLFEINSITNPDNARALWHELPEVVRSTEPMLDRWFQLNLTGDDPRLLDTVSFKLLQLNARHRAALEWQAEKYYNMAEVRYQEEMQKYNRNRTHVQYQFLLNSLREISEIFRQSLRYFEVLWELNPNPGYAAYISNIYVRFDDRDRAEHYRRLANP